MHHYPILMCSGRRSGKTIRLIQLAAERGGVLVVPNMEMVKHAVEYATSKGLHIERPITHEQFLDPHCYRAANIKEFYVDDLDVLMRKISPRIPVNTITTSLGD